MRTQLPRTSSVMEIHDWWSRCLWVWCYFRNRLTINALGGDHVFSLECAQLVTEKGETKETLRVHQNRTEDQLYPLKMHGFGWVVQPGPQFPICELGMGPGGSNGPCGSNILWFTRWWKEARETSFAVLHQQAPPQSLVLSEETKQEWGGAGYLPWLLRARSGKTNCWNSSLSGLLTVYITKV